jgi:hypothetical protein
MAIFVIYKNLVILQNWWFNSNFLLCFQLFIDFQKEFIRNLYLEYYIFIRLRKKVS